MRTLTLALLVACTTANDEAIGDTGSEDTAAEDTGTEDTDTGPDFFPAVSGGDSPSAQFALEFALLEDEDGDGDWEIGEGASLFVRMINTGEDDFAYPGCELRSDDLASGQSEWPFFGIGGGEAAVCEFALEHLPDARAGDLVAVQVIADRLNCEDSGDCPEANPLSIRFLLHPAG